MLNCDIPIYTGNIKESSYKQMLNLDIIYGKSCADGKRISKISGIGDELRFYHQGNTEKHIKDKLQLKDIVSLTNTSMNPGPMSYTRNIEVQKVSIKWQPSVRLYENKNWLIYIPIFAIVAWDKKTIGQADIREFTLRNILAQDV